MARNNKKQKKHKEQLNKEECFVRNFLSRVHGLLVVFNRFDLGFNCGVFGFPSNVHFLYNKQVLSNVQVNVNIILVVAVNQT